MSAENIGLIVAVVATFITVITSTVIIVRHFTKLENKVDRIRDGVNQNIRQSNGILGLFGTLIGLLGKKGVVAQEDFGSILKDFTEIGHISEINPNPLSREEVDRLNGYIRKAQQGSIFTSEEVQEYTELVEKLETEKPDDPNVWPLIALGAFLLGLFLASKK